MRRIFLFIVCLAVSAGCCLAEEPLAVKRAAVVSRMANFHIISPGIMRSAQPSDAAIKLLRKDYGLKTILDLQSTQEAVEKEKNLADELGIKFFNVPMKGTERQAAEKIEQCLNIISDKNNQPVLVHCYAGKDRTGLVIAAYRIKYEGWSLDQALTEMLAYGYDQERCINLEKSLREWNDWQKQRP